MNITCIVFGIMFLITGVLFAAGKIHTRMAVWKNMPEKEKEKIKIIPLCRNIGEMIALSGGIFLLKGFWHSFSDRWFSIAMIVWLIAAGLDVWLISKSKRYKNP